MRAAFFNEHGGPEVLELGELPEPTPGPGEVLVAVEAVALNHLDLWVRRGWPGLELDMPHVGGSDIAGRVAQLGAGVTGWSEGDPVVVNPARGCDSCEHCEAGEICLCPRFHIIGEHVAGGLVERIAVPAANLYRRPDDYPAERAAAAPLVFQTAWRALIGRARLGPGETVLITGASGGVSTAGIQIAKLAGATVFAVTSGPDNIARVANLGADLVIDRLEEDFAKRVWQETSRRGVDVVLDGVGQAMWPGMLRSLATGGRLVSYGATTGYDGEIDIRRLFWKQAEILGSTMASRSEFARVMSLVFAGRLEPVIGEVFPLEQIRGAHERLEAGEAFGKLVLTV